jgi:hypothetical protein
MITRYRVHFGFLIFPYITYAAVKVSNTKINCTNMVINILESTIFFPFLLKPAFTEESANISPENVVKITQHLSFCICRCSIQYSMCGYKRLYTVASIFPSFCVNNRPPPPPQYHHIHLIYRKTVQMFCLMFVQLYILVHFCAMYCAFTNGN